MLAGGRQTCRGARPVPYNPAVTQTPEELRLLRRARREERRARQRQQNALRAEKMHAARLEYQRSNRLPTPAPTLAPARPHRTEPAQTIHVGCSGWFYW